MISEFIYELCHSTETVSSVLAQNKDCVPGDVAKKLFAKRQLPSSSNEDGQGYNLERAYACGKWGGSRPSDLFLKVRVSFILEGRAKSHRSTATYWGLLTRIILLQECVHRH